MFGFKPPYQQLTDEQLMARVVKGEEPAFNELYQRYAGPFHRYFYRMLYRDVERANDAVQELFLKIIEKADQFDTGRLFSAWAYRMAANLCKNEYRRISRLHSRMEKLARTPEPSAPDITEQMDREQFDRALQEAIGQLEEPHRQCFILRYQQALAIKDIAEILNCPEGTVKSRLFYCVKKLSARLRSLQSKS